MIDKLLELGPNKPMAGALGESQWIAAVRVRRKAVTENQRRVAERLREAIEDIGLQADLFLSADAGLGEGEAVRELQTEVSKLGRIAFALDPEEE